MIDGAPNPRKRIETRSWPTTYRGPLAIHAAKSIDDIACRRFGYDPKTIPRGVVLGTVVLVECFSFNIFSIPNISAEEQQYGDYAFGRYGFRCERAVKYELPKLAKGHLGIWEWAVEKK